MMYISRKLWTSEFSWQDGLEVLSVNLSITQRSQIFLDQSIHIRRSRALQSQYIPGEYAHPVAVPYDYSHHFNYIHLPNERRLYTTCLKGTRSEMLLILNPKILIYIISCFFEPKCLILAKLLAISQNSSGSMIFAVNTLLASISACMSGTFVLGTWGLRKGLVVRLLVQCNSTLQEATVTHKVYLWYHMLCVYSHLWWGYRTFFDQVFQHLIKFQEWIIHLYRVPPKCSSSSLLNFKKKVKAL